MPRVIHFEIPADDPKRAVSFYEQAFGWKISKWEGPQDYWLASTGEQGQPGIDGAITSRSSLQTICNTIDVPSIDDACRKVAEAGGKVLTPVMAIPGVGRMAYCVDTEGNQFGIMQADPTAH
jgi:predicted enzyme related to lactoylglutathione lyase